MTGDMLRNRSLLLVAGLPCAEPLGLGDLIRVVMMLPALGASRVGWCSPPSLFALVRDCPAVTEHIPLDALEEAAAGFDFTLNLSFADLPGALGMRDLLGNDAEPLKQRTFDLVDRLAGRLGIATPPPQPVARPKAGALAVGFNFRLPSAWQIKAMPDSLWRELERLMPPDLPVSWQPDESGLDSYLEWVRSCRLLVSTVGLGCHLAMFYGLPLVVLSGPTDFAELQAYPRAKTLYPHSACAFRPCQKPEGVNGCGGCMHHFVPGDIAAAVQGMLSPLSRPADLFT